MSSGYVRRSVAGAEALAPLAMIGWLSDLLSSGRTLHGWAEDEGDAGFSGRGVVYAVPAPVEGPDGRTRWAVRHYRRGGVPARWLDDRYLALGRVRPVVEAEASAAARARGVPTPAVVGAAWYPAGLFYRADLATELLPDAPSLANVLFDEAGEARGHGGPHAGGAVVEAARSAGTASGPTTAGARLGALGAAGRLVRRLADRGVRHADLNAMNVLLPREAPEHAWVVDLDRASIGDDRPVDAAPMLARLERSLAKLGVDRGPSLARAEWAALRDGVSSP